MNQMTLGDMIATLQRKDPEESVRLDFVHFQPKGVHSYRGYYEQLAIGYESGSGTDVKVKDLLAELVAADGKRFYGYKGGEYTMGPRTPVWIANHNEAGGTAVVDIRDDSWCIRIITACIE